METLITLFLCGDLMLGRGVDQILPRAVDPLLHEPYVKDAGVYVQLAEARNGRIERPVGYEYIWGDALDLLERTHPDVRIVNLESAATTRDDPWPGKGIHYRMHPQNVKALTVAGIDAAVIANNHVLDWGHAGLLETIQTLEGAGIAAVGAGADAARAAEPAILPIHNGERRVLVFAYATPDSGVFSAWAARADRPGVNYLPDLSDRTFQMVARNIARYTRQQDLVIFSVHWGGNWGYDIPQDQIDFAHRLVDEAGVDIVHGHSSHHVKGIEIYKDRLILYGAGDFFNDYEGIGGREEYRPDLSLMYFPIMDGETGVLKELELVPMQIRRMRLNRAGEEDVQWMRDLLNRQSQRFGVRVEMTGDGRLRAGREGALEPARGGRQGEGLSRE